MSVLLESGVSVDHEDRLSRLEALLALYVNQNTQLLQTFSVMKDASVCLESMKQYAFVAAKALAHLCSNAYYDGVNWQRYDTALPSAVVVPNGAVPGFSVYTAVAGANPIAWTIDTVTHLSLVGLAGVGATMQTLRVANLAVAAVTATNLVSLTLTVGKWLVSGWAVVGPTGVGGTMDVALDQGHGANNNISSGALAAGAAVSLHAPPTLVTVNAGTQVVNLYGYANVAFTAFWAGGVIGNGHGVGISAVRVG